ncbi:MULTISPECIES: class I SAM-dependent methyltransferase [Bacillaceae]|uniref:Class I SAM-dependent methyltransferase n=1 Tax=Evansella alkalicola TaxID=745819 RepID=A0ABS6JWG4_9BACI|nr:MULTISPECIES: class I SAM-dependent methyltransferase [Bacillaceae]MBU9722838.1 class I SAM-dependent methyltransferase [Bacillus alkalicola]
MSRVQYIRNAEKKYHDACYENYRLFQKGSWLYKPVKTVMDILPIFDGKEGLKVLDLGAGVGRNSIPVAEKIKDAGGKVVCVDLLDSAIEKLMEYSKEFNVENAIQPIKSDIGRYQIEKSEYDYIIAVSSLEHVASEDEFESVIHEMANGTKVGGVNCIIVNSEVKEFDVERNKELEALMEVNIPTDLMKNKLDAAYSGWEKVKELVKPLEFQIERDGRPVLLKTNAITSVMRKV